MSVAGRKRGVYTTVTVSCAFCGCMLEVGPHVAAASKHHFCNSQHFGKWRTKKAQRSRLAIFLKHIPDMPSGDECWEWRGVKNNKGYGFIGAPARVYAHRLSYEQFVGPIPEGLFVCHHCDNPGCVRPSHLFVGTQKDNMADCSRKGRTTGGSLPGERNPFAKLTEGRVHAARQRLASGEMVTSIARDFGVSIGTISHIKNGRSWTHVGSLETRGI